MVDVVASCLVACLVVVGRWSRIVVVGLVVEMVICNCSGVLVVVVLGLMVVVVVVVDVVLALVLCRWLYVSSCRVVCWV